MPKEFRPFWKKTPCSMALGAAKKSKVGATGTKPPMPVCSSPAGNSSTPGSRSSRVRKQIIFMHATSN